MTKITDREFNAANDDHEEKVVLSIAEILALLKENYQRIQSWLTYKVCGCEEACEDAISDFTVKLINSASGSGASGLSFATGTLETPRTRSHWLSFIMYQCLGCLSHNLEKDGYWAESGRHCDDLEGRSKAELAKDLRKGRRIKEYRRIVTEEGYDYRSDFTTALDRDMREKIIRSVFKKVCRDRGLEAGSVRGMENHFFKGLSVKESARLAWGEMEGELLDRAENRLGVSCTRIKSALREELLKYPEVREYLRVA